MQHRSAKQLLAQRVVFVPLQELWKYLQHCRHVAEHRLELRFNELVGVFVGRLPDGLVATLVLGKIGDRRQHHLGVADARRLPNVDLGNVVVRHAIHHGHLVGVGRPALFDVGRFRRQIEVTCCPFGQPQRIHRLKRLHEPVAVAVMFESVDAAARGKIESLLAHYVHAIDNDALETWPDFFVEDCRYLTANLRQREFHERHRREFAT